VRLFDREVGAIRNQASLSQSGGTSLSHSPASILRFLISLTEKAETNLAFRGYAKVHKVAFGLDYSKKTDILTSCGVLKLIWSIGRRCRDIRELRMSHLESNLMGYWISTAEDRDYNFNVSLHVGH
jgi:hypothetical protein